MVRGRGRLESSRPSPPPPPSTSPPPPPPNTPLRWRYTDDPARGRFRIFARAAIITVLTSHDVRIIRYGVCIYGRPFRHIPPADIHEQRIPPTYSRRCSCDKCHGVAGTVPPHKQVPRNTWAVKTRTRQTELAISSFPLHHR